MSAGAWAMTVALVLAAGSLAFILATMVRTIRKERSVGAPIWREFSLGLTLMLLFFATWVAHGIAQWQTYTDEQRTHGESVSVGDFVDEFSESTLENWQSEFLQLFAFVVLAGLYVHKGSAESKDSEEKLEASLRRIEEKLGTLPDVAARRGSDGWKLPDDSPELAPH